MPSPWRSALIPAVAVVALFAGGTLVAQMESGDRVILPIDSSGTLEIGGIKVDVARQGRRRGALRGLAHRPARRLQGAVGQDQQAADQRSADAERFGARQPGRLDRRRRASRSGPTATSPSLASCSTARAAGALLGVGGPQQRSAPMLLIPLTTTARDGDLGRAEECVAAGVGAISHLAKRDRLCPGERDGGRSLAGQRRAGAPPGARMVAQHHRFVRRVERAGGRGQPQAALSRRAGARLTSPGGSGPTATAWAGSS